MDNDKLVFKAYLERFVPNLTPDEFTLLHRAYQNDRVQINYLDSHQALLLYSLECRGLVIRTDDKYIRYDYVGITITEAGRAKYRELTSAE